MRGHQNIIQIDENRPNTVTIWDPTGIDALSRPELRHIDPSCWARNFTYDHCLLCTEDSEVYESQEQVFETMGKPVVEWAIGGFNSCVLAYGQTGAGKSFTMMGTDNPAEFGLIPRICFGLFEHFEACEEEGSTECSMEFSFLEIYNENLRDCLSPHNNAVLKVREDPREGTYITHLTTVAVTNFEDILSLITIGNKSRAVASTKANVQSSRSHAIVTLSVRQRFRDAPLDGLRTSALRQKLSKVHLVDLAGSERVTHSGAVGMRLREANNINKSLSVLGDVIKCLGEASKQKSPGHIPYRNSVLTMVLRNSLGGNSRTAMVAAVSPSSMDYEETISTLKYADNAKKVRMRVAANVTSGLLASDGGAMQLVPVLQAEVEKLRQMLQAQQRVGMGGMDGSDETMEIVREMRARVSELEEQLAEREELIKNLEQSRLDAKFDDPRSSYASSTSSTAQSSSANLDGVTSSRMGMRSQPYVVLADDAIDTSLPRLINLNQDPLFSECLVYYIPKGVATAGSSEVDVDILLSGPDILSKHCLLHNESDCVYITASCEEAKVYVNGQLLPPPIEGSTERFYLRHFDRISMGKYHLFRFEAKGKSRAVSPMKGSASVSISTSFSTEAPGWDFAHDELMLNKDTALAPRNRSPSGDGADSLYPPGYFAVSGSSSSADGKGKKKRITTRMMDTDSTSVTRNDAGDSSRIVGGNKVAEQAALDSDRENRSDVERSQQQDDDNEEWWQHVNRVAEGAVSVNTPAELREMLRSVVESAERQFEEAETQRRSKEVRHPVVSSVTVSEFRTSVSNSTQRNNDNVEVSNDTPIREAPLTSQSKSEYVASPEPSHDQETRDVADSAPPPPPPLPSPMPENSGTISNGKHSSTRSSAADLLFAERRRAAARSGLASENNIPSGDQNADKSTGATRGKHRYDIVSETDDGFEDEASSLQKDMIAMQQKLRERMERYRN